MPFSDTTNKLGILQACESWVFGPENYGFITDSAARLATFTRLCNNALDQVTSKIFNSDTRWEFDDANFTDKPVATTDLVAGQQSYEISVSHLKIFRLEVLDAAGNYQLIKPFDQRDISDTALTEYKETDALPQLYRKFGEIIDLYPAPAASEVTLAAGLKIYYQREPSYFASTDTTKEPGFASIFHELVPLWASYDYMNSQQMDTTRIAEKIQIKEQELQRYYSKRAKDEVYQLYPQRGTFR